MADVTVGRLVALLGLDKEGYDRGLRDAENRATQAAKKIGDTMMKVGKTLTTFVTLPILGLGGAMVKSAASLQESVNAVNVAFGDAGKTITNFSRNAAREVGLTETQVNQSATLIGSLLQNVGFSAEEAAGQSVELTKRAADMASVFDTDVQQALDAIASALRGEANPIERFSVSINEAMITARAETMGLTGELDLQQKAMIRLQLIMEQTEKLAGDFSNTQDSFANATKTLRAEIGDIAADFGEMLLPAMEDIVAKVREAVGWFGNLDDSTKETMLRVAAFAAAAGPAAVAIGLLSKAVLALNAAMVFLVANPVVAAIIGVTAVVGGLAVAIGRARDEANSFEGRMDDAAHSLRLADDAGMDMRETIESLAENLELPIARVAELAREQGFINDELVKEIANRTALTELVPGGGGRVRGEMFRMTQEDIDAIEAKKEAIEDLAGEEKKLAEIDLRALEINAMTRARIAQVDQLQLALGDTYDGLAEKARIYTETLKLMVEEGMRPQDPAISAMRDKYHEVLGVMQAMGGMNDEQKRQFQELEDSIISFADATEEANDDIRESTERRVHDVMSLERRGFDQQEEWLRQRAAIEEKLAREEEQRQQERRDFAMETIASLQTAFAQWSTTRQSQLQAQFAAEEQAGQGTKALQEEIADVRERRRQAEEDGEEAKAARLKQTEEDLAESIKQIERERAMEIAKIERQAFQFNKLTTLAEIAVKGSLAVVDTLASFPGGPIAKGIAASVVGGLAAVQAGLVLKQEPPPLPAFQHGGLVGGQGGTDSVIARVTPGEFVVPPEQTARNLELLEGIRNNTAGLSGMQASVVIQLDRETVGRAVARWMEEASERGVVQLSPRAIRSE